MKLGALKTPSLFLGLHNSSLGAVLGHMSYDQNMWWHGGWSGMVIQQYIGLLETAPSILVGP